MPLYEFYCSDCRQRFERLTTYATAASGLLCPTCQGSHVRKLFSVFATAGRGGADGFGDDGDEYSDDYDAAGGCSCGGACACGGH